ncbi:VirD4-like conjugal transfer protein, CD1115 family, partial [Clostridium botulinum]
ILSAILLALVPIGSKIGIDIVEKYKFKMENIPKNYIKDVIYNVGTYKNFKLDNPISIALLCLVGYFIFTMLFNSFVKDNKYESSYSYGSHGTSRWQTNQEIKDNYYDDGVGWFIGSLKEEDFKLAIKAARHTVSNKKKLNMQVVVIGPPGSNKTTGLVLPTIFNLVDSYVQRKTIVEKNCKKKKYLSEKYNEGIKKIIPEVYKLIYNRKINMDEMPDLVITDPKPELYRYTADYLEKSGYDLIVFDFIDLMYGDSLNILDFIEDDKTLMQVAKGYIDSVDSSDDGASKGEQQFWNDQEAQVLAALMGFVKQKYPKDKQNITEVSKILTSEDISDIDSAKEFFAVNNVKGAAEQLWKNFLMIADSERTRANILGGLADKLKLFAIQGIQNITNKSTFNLKRLGTRKDNPVAIFILMPDDDRTFSPIINTFITTMFKQLYKTARKTKARLEVPVYCIFEEMANIGRIPNIKQMLGGMRGRRIYPMMIWQSLSQMEERYGSKGYKDIMSMCDTQIYLGINDSFTANACSDDLGFTTIKVQGTNNKTEGGMLKVERTSESNNFMQRKLLFPDECKKLDNKKLIMIQRSLNPVMLYKTQYKYWEYNLSKEKSIFDLKRLEQCVSNITPCSEQNLNKRIKEQMQKRESKYRTVENAEIDSNMLSGISDSVDEIEI